MNKKKTANKTKRGKTVETSEEKHKKLRLLAAELDVKLKDLGDEAIELLLEKYKKK